MSKQRISVIIPTFNRPSALEHCLRSLAVSDYPHDRFEIIVVDDGSDPPAAASVPGRLTVRLLHEANAGPSAARNAGANLASGDLLAFTDDDCEIDPGWLSALATEAVSAPGCLLGGRTLNGLPANPYAEASSAIIDIVYRHYNADPENALFFASNNMAIPADGYDAIGGFAESFRVSEDREICDWWRASGRRLRYAPDAVVHHKHAMDLSGYLALYFSYGRGACRYHKERRRRGSGTPWSEVTPHRDIGNWLLRPLSQQHGLARVRLLSLLGCWQIANALGYAWEGLAGQDQRSNRRAGA
ncbi:MAG: glycosyltransferase [bacterium]|nr:glycosyltransferase [bacterium]